MYKLFDIFDYTKDFRLGGAEVFLHPKAEEIIIAADKFKDKFEYLCLVTNGTFVPRNSIFETISKMSAKVVFRVDDYGKLSTKISEIDDMAKQFQIELDVRPYTEEQLSFGGWIDLGNYSNKNYTSEQVAHIFQNCKLARDCVVAWDGILHSCVYCLSGYNLEKIELDNREYIDLFDDAQTIEQQREKIMTWRSFPYIGCEFCNGYDTENSVRIPPAIQIGGGLI
jgi:hypothetical protein